MFVCLKCLFVLMFLSVYYRLFVRVSVRFLFVCLLVCLFITVSLFVCLFVCLSVGHSVSRRLIKTNENTYVTASERIPGKQVVTMPQLVFHHFFSSLELSERINTFTCHQ